MIGERSLSGDPYGIIVTFGGGSRSWVETASLIRAFVFDLDGTLVETEELKALSYARAAVELRPDLDEAEVVEAFKDFVGRSRQEVAAGLVRRFGLEEATRSRMAGFGVNTPWQVYIRVRLQIYDALLSDRELILSHRYPHNIALLHELRGAGYRTGLATMSHTEQTRRVLFILGLMDAFEVVATRDDVEHGKPDPEIDLLVARELGVEPEDCLVIEDSPTGIAAALAAGMDVIAVTTELTRQKFRDTDLLDRSRVVTSDNPGHENVRRETSVQQPDATDGRFASLPRPGGSLASYNIPHRRGGRVWRWIRGRRIEERKIGCRPRAMATSGA